MTVEPERIPPCLIQIDKEGRWYHKGAEITRRDFVRFFYENMVLDSQGRYLIHWEGQVCYVDVEDTAHVILRAVREAGDGSQGERYRLILSDSSEEDLRPQTLWVGKDNVLYCKVKNGSFPARFTRAAYYQLAHHMEEENGTFFLSLNGKKFFVRIEEGAS
jgi:hypothetical protein